jgi:hypothetical protein
MKLNDKIRKKLFKEWNGILVQKYSDRMSKMKDEIYDEMVESIGDTNQQDDDVTRNPQEYGYFQREWVTTILMEVEKLVDTERIEYWIGKCHLNQNGVRTYGGEDRTFEELKQNPNWKQVEERLDDYFERHPQWKKEEGK